MGMRCSRVGCSGNAVASFCFDGRAALVWLDPLDPERGVGAGVLCARHADTLTPPRGWHLQDRRTRTPRLWVDRPAAATSMPRAKEPAITAPATNGDAIAARASTPPADPLPFETAARTKPEPRYPATTTEPADVDDLLDARSPMLARAFAAAGSVPEHLTRER